MYMRRTLFSLALGVVCLAGSALAQPAKPVTNDDVIYYPMTDRFHRSQRPATLPLQSDDPNGFHGGDLRGLAEKADYIRDLGCTVLWLGPFWENTFERRVDDFCGKGYHGYWIHSYEKVDPHLGSEADLVDMVKTFKSKGIKVIADVVLNQVGPDHPWLSDPDKFSWFHHEGTITNYQNRHEVEHGDLAGLPDLNQDNPQVYKYLLDNTAHWVNLLDLDGLRLDAVKHIPSRFWTRFLSDLRRVTHKPDLFIVGEVFTGEPENLYMFQDHGIDYLFDIPIQGAMSEVFGKDASAKKLGECLAQDKLYHDANKMVTLMDNHDMVRFITASKGDFPTRLQRLKLASAFLLSVRGLPQIYYGTEVAMEGGADPDNRRDMDFQRQPEMRKYMTHLLHMRQRSEALRRGKQVEVLADDQVYAFARRSPNQEAICVFNNADTAQTRQLTLPPGGRLVEGSTVVDGIQGGRYTVKNGRLELSIAPRTALILLSE